MLPYMAYMDPMGMDSSHQPSPSQRSENPQIWGFGGDDAHGGKHCKPSDARAVG